MPVELYLIESLGPELDSVGFEIHALEEDILLQLKARDFSK